MTSRGSESGLLMIFASATTAAGWERPFNSLASS